MTSDVVCPVLVTKQIPFSSHCSLRDFLVQHLHVNHQLRAPLDLLPLPLEMHASVFLTDSLTTNVQTSTTIEWRLWSGSSQPLRRRWRRICRRQLIRKRASSSSRLEVRLLIMKDHLNLIRTCHGWFANHRFCSHGARSHPCAPGERQPRPGD